MGVSVNMDERAMVRRIEAALQAACAAITPFMASPVVAEYKSRHDPVTEADRAADRVLRQHLQQPGEGWLSEESPDNDGRLGCENVWVVDPLDGTAEFVAGIPEWCVSVGLVHQGRAWAGGICNPATREIFLGARNLGITYNQADARASNRETLDGAVVLASRSEFQRGDWEIFQQREFSIRPVGSIAYKLALVAAGKADATWSRTARHEWDVAAGVALVEAAGGFASTFRGGVLTLNNPDPRIPGLMAGGAKLRCAVQDVLARTRALASSGEP